MPNAVEIIRIALEPALLSNRSSCIDVAEALFRYLKKGQIRKLHEVLSVERIVVDLLREPSAKLDTFRSDLHRALCGGVRTPSKPAKSLNHYQAEDGPGIVDCILKVASKHCLKELENEDPEAQAGLIAYAAILVLDDAYSNDWLNLFRARANRSPDVFEFEGGLFPRAPAYSEKLMQFCVGFKRNRVALDPDRADESLSDATRFGYLERSELVINFNLRLCDCALDLGSDLTIPLSRAIRLYEAAGSGVDFTQQKVKPVLDKNREILRDVGYPMMLPMFDHIVPKMATALLNRWKEIDMQIRGLQGEIRCVSSGNAQSRYDCSDKSEGSSDTPQNIQFRRIKAVIRCAKRHGVDILVLPELCVDEQIADLVIRFLDANIDDVPSVVAIGSYHKATSANGQRNIAPLWIRAEEGQSVVNTHYKFNRLKWFTPFEVDETEKKMPRAEGLVIQRKLEEKLDNLRPALTVQITRSISIMSAVCKDMLSPRLQRTAPLIRPNIMLVPALTTECKDFEVVAATLATQGKIVTVIANNGILRDDVNNLTHGESDSPRVSEVSGRWFGGFGVRGTSGNNGADLVRETSFSDLPILPQVLILQWAFIEEDEFQEPLEQTGATTREARSVDGPKVLAVMPHSNEFN